MSQTPLDEFLAYELNESIRSELINVISHVPAGQRYFTYNTFNVRLDLDSSTVTVEDELDVDRQTVLELREFGRLLTRHGS